MIYAIREIAGKNNTELNEKIKSMKSIESITDTSTKDISDLDKHNILVGIREICTYLSKNNKIKIRCNAL
ncbi:hypothetical protein NEIRO03_2479 [Nematocida sp. AWRm78]|nr:hypothetical protein NEIRO02_1636 [Nematocida sp. AWRm79]KAI5187203.1 hypothetical protein NEIRO03_2479 [Nematocida sp. AWRm78]